MLLGLLLHVCIFFMPPHKYFWGAGDYHGDVLNLQFLSFIHLFRMQLFFLLAGFFAELVIDRKGLGHFTADRCKRILLPFIVGVVVMVPIFTLLIGNGGYYRNTYDGMSIFEIVRTTVFFGLLEPGQPIRDGLIHYWFVYYLLLFYIAHLLARPLLLSGTFQSLTRWDRFLSLVTEKWWGFLLLGLLIFPLQYILKSVFLPPTGFNVPVADLLLYFLFYLFGSALYLKREKLESLTRNAWYYAAFSVPLFILINQPTERIDLSAPVINDITTWTVFDLGSGNFAMPQIWSEGIFHNGWGKIVVVLGRTTLCWSLCFASIGLASRYLSRENQFIRYLADSAYWVYWVHMPITFKLSYMAQPIEGINSVTKCYVVLVLSTLIVYASYQWFVRYGWLGNFFMGRKKSAADPVEQNYTISTMSRKMASPVLMLGVFFFFVGSLLHYNRSFQKSEALVEAYVTRDAETLKACGSLEGIRDLYGNTPLHASQFAPEKTRRYDPLPILISGLDHLDHQNDFGRTALFYAARNGNLDDLGKILDAGADIDIADRYGHTPAHVAAILTGNRNAGTSKSYQQLLATLINRGASLSLKDSRGRTVADCLRQFGGLELSDIDGVGGGGLDASQGPGKPPAENSSGKNLTAR